MKCLTTECERNAVVRGVCSPCYAASRRLIKAGETTDEQLVIAGALLPPAKPGRRSLFHKQLERSKAKP